MFDGDEMNIHIAQSVQARNELKRIANVKYQIIGAKDSNPIIGCVQDALSGCYLLTKLNNKISGSDVANFLCNTSSDSKFEIDKKKYYTGHEIFSHIIPKGINNTVIKNDKKVLEIIDGELKLGTLDKNTLSTVKNSIIHFIWDKYGPDKTRRFIDDAQRLAISYLNYRGFTFGIKDCISNNIINEQVKDLIQNKILEYKISLTQYENDIEQINQNIIEANLSAELNAFSSDIGNILLKSLNPENNLFVCIDSKSKGNTMNLQHIMACVGQKSVEGTRIKKKIENRTLSIFHRDDDSPEARGFIKNSYLDGLNSYEFFYDAMAGREGLIDTAIKSVTWETPIIIIEDEKPIYTEIGKWIDNLLETNKNSIEHFEERQMELLQVNNIYIPTTDYKGNVSWGNVSAITRHDPGTQLYEIKTSGGRSVTVTESKSLLIWNKETEEFKELLTPDIKLGDFVPVTVKLPEPPIILNDSKYNISNIILELDNGIFQDDLYIASNKIIRKILELYYCKYCIIHNNSISIELSSKNVVNGISYLFSRFGIYGTINNNIFLINEQYFEIFFKKIFLSENKSNSKNIKTCNNVVLDKIIEINLIDVKNHPKVYDLTIPSTFNFGLANGLQVRDTAKTGYIQRQLIKGLEDLVIKYDNTNRNSRNVIIQYIYGENGIEQSSQTELQIKLISLDNKEIEFNYGFSKDEIKKIEKEHKLKNLESFNKDYINKIKNFRDKLRIIQATTNNNYKTLEEKYMLPVNLFRLTQDYSKNKVNLELNPEEIINDIDELLNSSDTRLLPGLRPTDKYLIKDDRSMKYLFEIALNDYLCPKKCIFEYGLSKKDFKQLLADIKFNFIKALIQPGEMVGIIAAQSIGEPTSQMSQMKNQLNKIIIKNKVTNCIKMISTEIGPFCDEIIKNNPELTCGTGHVNSVETELDPLENEYYIIGVDGKEKTHWNKISHVSRHPVNGKVMKITTKSGRTVETTTSHSHLVRKNQTVVPIVGANMTVGMRIPVAKHIDNKFIKESIEIDGCDFNLDYLFGWFVGAYLAEGHLSKNTNKITGCINITNISEHFINNTKLFAKRFNKECRMNDKPGEYGPGMTTSFNNIALANLLLDTCVTGSFVKRVPDFAFIAPNEFKAGLLQAYFDGDGNFQADDSRYQIRVCSRSEQLIKDIALLLSYFDMFGSIKANMSKGLMIYNLAMSAKYSILYKEHIGSLIHTEKLDQIVNYATNDLSDEIDKINGLGEVIAACGKLLNLPGQSRNYGRWKKKESIGRRTLEKYIELFEAHEDSTKIREELSILKQAANSNVIWDEVKEIKIYEIEPETFVYDFTVPGNQTFMTDTGIIVHNTLNTKHSAGVASKSTTNMGVSRIEELLHYSKDIKTPQMTVYFDEKICGDRSVVNKIASYLTHLNIKELITSAEIIYDIGSNDEISKSIAEDNVTNPFFINNQKSDLSSLPFVFRIKLNMENMHDKETTLLDIKTKFISHWTKNFTNFKNMKKIEKDIFSKINRCAILSNSSVNNQIIHIRFNMSSFNYNLLTDFLNIILNQITLKGIDNIKNSDMVFERKLLFNQETGASEVTKEYIVYTDGINLEKIKYIKGVNNKLSYCNDIATICRLYGIESARQILINEFNQTFNAGGTKSINHNHMSVLIDMMTHTGSITSIDRHGLGKVDYEPIAKASFEKTMDHFLNAAIFNEKDHIESVSSRIMMGRVIPGGTGCFELLLDTNKLENSEYTKNEKGGRVTFTGLEEESLFKDIINYGFSKNDFFIPV